MISFVIILWVTLWNNSTNPSTHSSKLIAVRWTTLLPNDSTALLKQIVSRLPISHPISSKNQKPNRASLLKRKWINTHLLHELTKLYTLNNNYKAKTTLRHLTITSPTSIKYKKYFIKVILSAKKSETLFQKINFQDLPIIYFQVLKKNRLIKISRLIVPSGTLANSWTRPAETLQDRNTSSPTHLAHSEQNRKRMQWNRK